MTSGACILREQQQNYFIFSCLLGSLKDQKQNKRSVQSMYVLTLYQGVLIFPPLKDTKSDQPKTTQTNFDLLRSYPRRKCILRERASKLMRKPFPVLSTPFFHSFSLSFFTLFHSFLLPLFSFSFPNTQLKKIIIMILSLLPQYIPYYHVPQNQCQSVRHLCRLYQMKGLLTRKKNKYDAEINEIVKEAKRKSSKEETKKKKIIRRGAPGY